MSLLLTPGQGGDNPQLLPLIDAIRVPRPGPRYAKRAAYHRASVLLAATVLWLR